MSGICDRERDSSPRPESSRLLLCSLIRESLGFVTFDSVDIVDSALVTLLPALGAVDIWMTFSDCGVSLIEL